ncbi:hypothetical protein PPNSA23_28430 [Phyllobacterium phragmitis]|uniref:Uncharacterized protein n=1 Tax=Phyllobacterium phragmitis TaxID=2670329 RepID=A0ABQ0H1V5_9HYPH
MVSQTEGNQCRAPDRAGGYVYPHVKSLLNYRASIRLPKGPSNDDYADANRKHGKPMMREALQDPIDTLPYVDRRMSPSFNTGPKF